MRRTFLLVYPEIRMIRIISILLCIAILSATILNTASCEKITIKPKEDADKEQSTPTADEENGELNNIITPAHRDYGRDAINFADISYERPNVEALISLFDKAAETVESKTAAYEDKLDAIFALEDDYTQFTTMLAYAGIMQSKNTADPKWLDEYTYLTAKEPELMRSVEKLFVAAATSEHCDAFERDYFGDGELEEYKDGSSYTDELVRLLEEETSLENTYSALSTATVKIIYNGKNATVDEHLSNIDAKYKDDEGKKEEEKNLCLAAYKRKYNSESKELLISLTKVRSKIATEYGYSSYRELAYGEQDRDYSERELIKFTENIAKYILPVFLKLNYSVFLPYFNSVTESTKVNAAEVINSLYEVYEDTDETLHEAYSYMLEYGLYDYEPAKINRFDGSFTTYLDKYTAPFVFISARSDENDYVTMAHEFGHFYDSYINYNSQATIDLAEISSISLEFLTLLELEDKLDEETYRYIYYTTLDTAMRALVFQGYYALFEHYAYSIPYARISEETLSEAAERAAREMGLAGMFTLDSTLIPHTLLYPFYVQSYCTATAVSLEIFYAECEKEGAGLAAYKELVLRENPGRPFKAELKAAGLTSPFTGDVLMKLADKIHFDLLGSHFYKESNSDNKAA